MGVVAEVAPLNPPSPRGVSPREETMQDLQQEACVLKAQIRYAEAPFGP
jgi:hypothetical protein